MKEKKSVEMNCEPVDPDPLHLSEIKKKKKIYSWKLKSDSVQENHKKKFNVGIQIEIFLLR